MIFVACGVPLIARVVRNFRVGRGRSKRWADSNFHFGSDSDRPAGRHHEPPKEAHAFSGAEPVTLGKAATALRRRVTSATEACQVKAAKIAHTDQCTVDAVRSRKTTRAWRSRPRREVVDELAGLPRQHSDHATRLDCLGRVVAMPQGVAVARWRSAARAVHSADAIAPHCGRLARLPAPLRSRTASGR